MRRGGKSGETQAEVLAVYAARSTTMLVWRIVAA